MQKLWLKNFEFGINPATWNKAQDLVQSGAVFQFQEVEKHFWVASVRDDGQHYEVEAMITPHKIKAYTCECWETGRRLMCAHVAASLLKVRQFLDQQKEARESSQSSKKEERSGRLSVPNILHNATLEDLQNFVGAYARRDRDFALALKTWFAGKIPGFDQPFQLVIDAALPRHSGAQALREPELRRLRKVLDDLHQQMTTANDRADAVTVFQIVTAVLEKISPLLPKLEEQKRQGLEVYLHKAVTQLLQLPADLLSPELRENRREFLLEYLQLSQEQPAGAQQIIAFLGQASTEDRFFNKIRALFDHSPSPTPTVILHLFITALAHRQLPEAVEKVLLEYSAQPIPLKSALETLYRQELWEALLLAGTHFLDQQIFNTWQQREIEGWLLNASNKSSNTVQIKAYLRRLYLRSGVEEAYLRLKKLAADDWPQEREQLISALQQSSDTARLANLLAAEGSLDALLQLLNNQSQLSMLQQFEEQLLPAHQSFVRNFYVEHLSKYLTEHFGTQASAQLRSQLNGLMAKGETALVKEVITELTARFPDRPNLPEDLAEMFPKAQRPSFSPN